jgi:hypothetical protein
MEDDNDDVEYGDDDIASRLAAIQSKKNKVSQQAESSSSSDDDVNEDKQVEACWKKAKLSYNSTQSALANSQGFTQDLSQDLTQLNTINYVPVPFRTPAEQAAVAEDWARVAARPVPPPLQMPDYRTDPHSPWAPGGFMNPNTPNNKLPPLLQQPSVNLRAPPAVASQRAASPASVASRAPSPASSSTTKQTAPKKKKDVAEEERLQKEIDTVCEHFRKEHFDKIQCEEERDLKNVKNSEVVNVARWLCLNKPQPHRLDLSTFNSKQIRKLALNCGVKGAGSLTLFAARKGIVMAITMGTVYDNNTISNPRTTRDERKVNTLMRLINACFHSEVNALFIDLNDAKKRKDYEKAHGGNPIKKFWTTVSEMTNDTERNKELGVVLESRLGEDEHLHDLVEEGSLNLNDFTAQTFLSAQQNMCDCMKARENCLGGMRVSGEHSNDLWTYVDNTNFTSWRVNMKPVPGPAVYYCHVLCTVHPEIDGKFAAFLDNKLKSDSDVGMTGSADSRVVAGDKKNKALDNLVATLSTATTSIARVLENKQVRSERVALDEEAKDDSKAWDEYLLLADRFIDMQQQPQKLPLLRNFAVRIRVLEKKCGISSEESITNGVAGIPCEVVTTVSTVGTATSDVTTGVSK